MVTYGQNSKDFHKVWIETINSDINYSGYLYQVNDTTIFAKSLKNGSEIIISIPSLEIEQIKIETNRKWLGGTLLGFGIGGIIGGAIGNMSGGDNIYRSVSRGIIGALGGGIACSIIGGKWQYSITKHKKIIINGKPSNLLLYKKEIEKYIN